MDDVPGNQVGGMVRRINTALDKRYAFERANKPSSPLIEMREADTQLRGNSTVARFLIVLGADPEVMLNRVRKDGYRSNLKAMRKVRMLAEYMAGHHGKINGVVKALFAASIIAAKENHPWVSNSDAEAILLRLQTSNPELLSSIAAFTALRIKSASEARNQACQFRTAFENLKVFYSSRDDETDLSSNGVRASMVSPLIQALAHRWGL